MEETINLLIFEATKLYKIGLKNFLDRKSRKIRMDTVFKDKLREMLIDFHQQRIESVFESQKPNKQI